MDFNYEEAQDLFNYFGGDEEAEITVVWLNEGHSGPGMYAYSTEYPEEGCILLGKSKSINVVLTDDERKLIGRVPEPVESFVNDIKKINEGMFRFFGQNVLDAIDKLKR